jgi:uncharacterized SAM-binding protein YcdF (DUF218 family)
VTAERNSSKKSRASRFWGLFFVLAAAAVLAVLFRGPLLGALGSFLVSAGPPQKADIVLVLAGDQAGNRILKAAELVREGYAPQVLVSGPGGNYGFYECDLAIPFAVKAGYPESYFLRFEHNARSTLEEAQAAAPELRRLKATRVLLVTSDYHTRRAGNVFRTTLPEFTFYVVASRDRDFSADGWWHDREGRKIFFLEWSKTVARWFGV